MTRLEPRARLPGAKHLCARGRIALSDGSLRSRGPVGGLHSALCESARNVWMRLREVKNGRGPAPPPRPQAAYRPGRLPLLSGQADVDDRQGGYVRFSNGPGPTGLILTAALLLLAPPAWAQSSLAQDYPSRPV